MKKDIIIPVIKDVHVAIIHEFNKEFLDKEWNVYVINNKTETIEMVLVVSKGYDNDRITSTMRHSIAKLDGKSYARVEMVQEDVLQLNNEFFVTLFADNKLFEKRFVFEKNTVNEANLTTIPLIDKDGVLAK